MQASYTWSKVIDNQSDPLLGDSFDLDFKTIHDELALVTGGPSLTATAFRTQFDSRGDRGLADFDQRHNCVVFGVQELPPAFAASSVAPLFRHWKIAGLAAARSGFPYRIGLPYNYDLSLRSYLLNNRANITDPAQVYTFAPAPGGARLLNSKAFGFPVPGHPGNSSRNAFEGPGLYSIDASLSRTFALRRLGDAGRFVLRADAFNLLNHANLNNPNNILGNPNFGFATYGRQGASSGFPTVTPFNETPRQIQILLRVDF